MMASTPAFRSVENAIEGLYEDERLRSNLDDCEAEVVLKWAEEWLTAKASMARDETAAQQIVKTEGQRVRAAVAALNALKPAASLPQAVAVVEPLLTSGKPFSREEQLILLTTLFSRAWEQRG